MKKLVGGVLAGLVLLLSAQAQASIENERLSLNFNDAYLISTLRVFDKSSDYTLVYPERVYGKVTAKIDDMPSLDALDRLLRGQGYDYLQDGKELMIYKKNDTAMYQYSFKLQYIQVKDVIDIIRNTIGSDGTVSFSHSLNTIAVKGLINNIKQAKSILEKMDSPPKQVLMKAKILEIKKSEGDADQQTTFGVDISYDTSTGDTPGNAVETLSNTLTLAKPTTGLYAQVFKDDVSAYITAIERTTDFELLASPWITAVNHHPSELLIGSKIGYKTTLISSTGTQENIEFLEVGIKLSFTPHISDDGYIRMSLSPSISEGKIIDGLPQENTTETTSEVLVQDGETVVIGGLTKTYESEIQTGVPFLSRLPILGALFGKTELIKEKRDLMILITPTIMTDESMKAITEKSKAMEETLMKNKMIKKIKKKRSKKNSKRKRSSKSVELDAQLTIEQDSSRR